MFALQLLFEKEDCDSWRRYFCLKKIEFAEEKVILCLKTIEVAEGD